MRRIRSRTTLAVIAVAVAIFVVAGGPATAGKLVTKNQIAPSAITNKAIANGAITDAKLSKSLRSKLAKTGASGAAGAPGAAGAAGAKGETGARGPAGAFNVVDSTGKVLGQSLGFWSSSLLAVYTAEGAILMYDNSNPSSFPTPTNPPVLFYKSNGCTGQAFGIATTGFPFQTAIVLEGPPNPGSKIYVPIPGTPENFTAESTKTSSGCSDTNSGASQVYTVKEAGTVPTMTKPVLVQPAS